MDWKSQISIDTDVRVGKPVIKGTRLTHEKVQACLAYASEILKAEKVYPLKV